jgi:hypothetical protein
MRRVRLAVFLACAGLVAASCAKERERPGPAGTHCGDDPRCVINPPIGGGGSGARDGGVGDSGFLDGSASINASIVLLPTDDFRTSQAFEALAQVRAEAPNGGEVSGAYDGQNAVELAGVALGPQVWFTVIPNLDPLEAMPTIVPVDTLQDPEPVLSVVPATTLEFIYELLAAPTTRQPDAGHVVLRFVRADNPSQPVEGVSIGQSTAEIVAYDTGGGWSEIDGATGAFGMAVLANVPAVPLPGSDQVVTVRGPVETAVRVRIARNAVTLGEVPLAF